MGWQRCFRFAVLLRCCCVHIMIFYMPAEHREEHTKVSGVQPISKQQQAVSEVLSRSERVLLPCVLSAVVVRVRVCACVGRLQHGRVHARDRIVHKPQQAALGLGQLLWRPFVRRVLVAKRGAV